MTLREAVQQEWLGAFREEFSHADVVMCATHDQTRFTIIGESDADKVKRGIFEVLDSSSHMGMAIRIPDAESGDMWATGIVLSDADPTYCNAAVATVSYFKSLNVVLISVLFSGEGSVLHS